MSRFSSRTFSPLATVNVLPIIIIIIIIISIVISASFLHAVSSTSSSSSSPLAAVEPLTPTQRKQIHALLEFKTQLNCAYGFTAWTFNFSASAANDDQNDPNNLPPCRVGNSTSNWPGVGCVNGTGEVGQVSIFPDAFFDVQCSGSFSPALADVQSLTSIDFSRPSGCDEISYNFFYPSINSTLPPEWGSAWPNIVSIDISCWSGLTGIIPPEWRGMKSIERLSLHNNALSGTLSADPFNSLVKLKTLNLYKNRFQGDFAIDLAFLQNLTELEILSLHDNQLTGILNPLLFSLTKLQKLSLANNMLSQELPRSWGYTNITQLYEGWSGDIDWTDVLGPNASAYLKVKIGMISLVSIDLSNMPAIISSIPESWYIGMSQMVEFVMSNCSLYGSLTETIGNWQNLVALDLDSNYFTSTLPKNMSKLGYLNTLELSRNQFKGEIPSEWASIGSMYTEVPNSNNITYQWQVDIDLSYNLLTGELPANFSNLTTLSTFLVSWNQLSGELPCEWKELQFLKYLYLAHNQFSGPLPACWADADSKMVNALAIVDFSFNNFTGVLPVSWSRFSMQQLAVSSNSNLGGTLPEEYSTWGGSLNVGGVYRLMLDNCNFYGSIPPSWSKMTVLQILDAHGNCLTVDNQTLSNLATTSSAFSLMYFDVSPNCLQISAINTSVPLAGPYLYRYIVPPQAQDYGYCSSELYKIDRFTPAVHTVDIKSFRFSFTVQSWVAQSSTTSSRQIQTINFFETCATALVRPVLQCWYNPYAYFGLSGSEAKSITGNWINPFPASWEVWLDDNRGYLIRCSQQGVSVDGVNATFPLPEKPSWHNVTQLVPPLPDGYFYFQASDAQYLAGARYRVDFVTGLHNYRGFSKYFQNSLFTRFFSGPTCAQKSSIQIALTTNCVPCPEYGVCSGASDIIVGATPVWRSTAAVLPLYPCPSSTKGCMTTSRFIQAQEELMLAFNLSDMAAAEQFQYVTNDGSGCMVGYTSYFCAMCAQGYGMVQGECLECPSYASQLTVMVIGIVVFVVALGLLVYVSIDFKHFKEKAKLSKKLRRWKEKEEKRASNVEQHLVNDNDDDGEKSAEQQQNHAASDDSSSSDDDETTKNQEETDADSSSSKCSSCIACKNRCCGGIKRQLVAWLDRYKPLLERFVVTIRQLINHFTLVGALSNTNAALVLSESVRRLLRTEQGANSFIFGSYAAGVSCMATGSTSIKIFELMWDVFIIAFVLEFFIFLLWFRQAAVTATVALFLSHLAYAPMAEAAAKLIALCESFTFYPQRAYLLNTHSNSMSSGASSDMPSGTPSTTIRLLSSDYTQSCDAEKFGTMRLAASLSLVFFSLGLPVLIVFLHRYWTIKGKTATRDEVLCFLIKHYKPDAWWFEALIMLRKLAVALIIGVMPTHGSLQLQLFGIVCTIMLVVSVKYMPLTSLTANRADQLSTASALACAVLMQTTNSFTNDIVGSFVAVVIFVIQVFSIVAIFIFSGSTDDSDHVLFVWVKKVCSCISKDNSAEADSALVALEREGAKGEYVAVKDNVPRDANSEPFIVPHQSTASLYSPVANEKTKLLAPRNENDDDDDEVDNKKEQENCVKKKVVALETELEKERTLRENLERMVEKLQKEINSNNNNNNKEDK